MDIEAVKKILTTLNLPCADIKIRPDEDSRRSGAEVYDELRGRWVALTPEEWVRQNFTAFVRNYRQWPSSLMANEVSIRLNDTNRRCDTVLYSRSLSPLCIVEYKAPEIAITQRVFDQIARYNSVLLAKYLIVSNGLHHYCCRYEAGGNSYTFIKDIPSYQTILSE